MASEQILQKSIMGGFKKEGVLSYVEQLQNEIISLKKELDDAKGETTKSEEISTELQDKSDEIVTLKEEIDELKKENAVLLEENASSALKIEAANATAEDYAQRLEACNAKIAAIESKFGDIERKYTQSASERTSFGNRFIGSSRKQNEAVKEAKATIDAVLENLGEYAAELEDARLHFEETSEAFRGFTAELEEVLTEISRKLSSDAE